MGSVLNNIATADIYTPANTLSGAPFTRLNVDASNAAVYVQLGQGSGGGINWGEEVFFTPSFRSLDRIFSGVRVRSAALGKPARVTVHALTNGDTGG